MKKNNVNNNPLVDWKSLFPEVEVGFSSLTNPHSCEDDGDEVVYLKFPNGYVVDVEYRVDSSLGALIKKWFDVVLYCGGWKDQHLIESIRCGSTEDILEAVQFWQDKIILKTKEIAEQNNIK